MRLVKTAVYHCLAPFSPYPPPNVLAKTLPLVYNILGQQLLVNTMVVGWDLVPPAITSVPIT
eukprot:1154199-Pelagomonas_calceolata.AAC.8